MTLRNPLGAVPLRVARWSATHPWRAIGAWAALVAVAIMLSTAVSTHRTEDADYRVGESGRADAMVAAAGFDDPDHEQVLITGADDAAGARFDLGEARRAAADLAGRLEATDGVVARPETVVSDDGKAVLVSIGLTPDRDDVSGIAAVVAGVAHEHRDLQLSQTGDVSLDDGIGDRVASDLGTAETVSLPLTLLLMLLAFGALTAAGLPVLLAGSSVVTAFGLMAPLSHLVPAEDTVQSMVVLIGMAVGVDYCLFYLKREREERAAGRSMVDAVEIAARTSGHSILVSGAAVIAAMAGLFLMADSTFNSLAVGSIVVVAVAVLGSLTVLPALLVKAGRFLDRPRVPLLWRLNRRIGRGGISARLLGPVVRHPAAALLLGAVVMTALAVPALSMRVHGANLDTLPADIPEVAAMRSIQQHFPSEGASALIVARAGDDAAATGRALQASVDDAIGRGIAVRDGSRVEESDGVLRLQVSFPWSDSDERVDHAVDTLRDRVLPAHLDGVTSSYALGGDAAQTVDSDDHLRSHLPWVIGFVLLLTLVLIGITFRSVPLALLSTVLNLGSVGVAFGLMTLVFQHGWGADVLGFTSPGFVIDWLPVFVLVVLVGLSMDYHVFVVNRIREHVRSGLPTRLAVQRGIGDTAGVVTSAAAVMVSVFSIFATLSMLEMKMMGVGLAAAIALDATVVRLVMLPAALVLLGERTWWPVRPDRPVGHVVREDREVLAHELGAVGAR